MFARVVHNSIAAAAAAAAVVVVVVVPKPEPERAFHSWPIVDLVRREMGR